MSETSMTRLVFSLGVGLTILLAVVCALEFDRTAGKIRNLNDRIERLEETPHEHTHDFGATSHAEPRSPKWPAVRKAYLATHPVCECCGEDGTAQGGLEVHHVESFHAHPEKELDPQNIIALCRRCHLLIGHLASFKRTNKHVREDAALIRKHIEEAKTGALAP